MRAFARRRLGVGEVGAAEVGLDRVDVVDRAVGVVAQPLGERPGALEVGARELLLGVEVRDRVAAADVAADDVGRHAAGGPLREVRLDRDRADRRAGVRLSLGSSTSSVR